MTRSNIALPYDQADPPEQPPAQAKPRLWRRAYQAFDQHRQRGDTTCACGHPWPCRQAELAAHYLEVACHADDAAGQDRGELT